jgi:hypothetical protein
MSLAKHHYVNEVNRFIGRSHSSIPSKVIEDVKTLVDEKGIANLTPKVVESLLKELHAKTQTSYIQYRKDRFQIAATLRCSKLIILTEDQLRHVYDHFDTSACRRSFDTFKNAIQSLGMPVEEMDIFM